MGFCCYDKYYTTKINHPDYCLGFAHTFGFRHKTKLFFRKPNFGIGLNAKSNVKSLYHMDLIAFLSTFVCVLELTYLA